MRGECSGWERSWGKKREREVRVRVWGCLGVAIVFRGYGVSLASLEARSSAWLRGLFLHEVGSANWPDPTYQTTKGVEFLDELGISELDQPTKHTPSLRV
jgi:hypothetical protein